MQTEIKVKIKGMSCASCAIGIEKTLNQTEGVENASVSFNTANALISYDTERVSTETIKKAIERIGYEIVTDPIAEEHLNNAALATLKRNVIGASLFAIPLAVVGMFAHQQAFAPLLMLALATPVLGYFGRSFFVNAWKQAIHGILGMDSLVAVSTGVAYLFSTFNTIFPKFFAKLGLYHLYYFEAAAMIIFFVLLGKWLEEKAKSNSANSIRRLLSLKISELVVIKDGKRLSISPDQVQIGDHILIKPGQQIPVDGKIIDGQAHVDNSSLSGEAIPVFKAVGDKVFAGTLNLDGSLTILAEEIGADTYLSQIIRMVENAQASKASLQRLVDKISGIFVPTVFFISILTFILWMVFGTENRIEMALLSALSVLVIACPCALGLATPMAISVGIEKAAKLGILVKDADSLERIKKVNTIIFDKTGTITAGQPEVKTFQVFGNESEILPKIKGLEIRSEHPLAKAILHYLNAVEEETPEYFHTLPGKGIQGAFNRKNYFLGNLQFLEGFKTNPANLKAIETIQNSGQTLAVFRTRDEILALIGLADSLKAGSADAVKSLQQYGLETIILTGDHEKAAARVANEVGISRFIANCLPADKAKFIENLQKNGGVVAMVGDGLNDSVSLAQADVGIAMGSGADAALATANLTIISNDLRKIPIAISLSTKTSKIVRQNLFWASIYNLFGIPIAAGLLYPINGLTISPMWASAAMALSSISVVINSLRLKNTKLT